jgi:hypothetical protein
MGIRGGAIGSVVIPPLRRHPAGAGIRPVTGSTETDRVKAISNADARKWHLAHRHCEERSDEAIHTACIPSVIAGTQTPIRSGSKEGLQMQADVRKTRRVLVHAVLRRSYGAEAYILNAEERSASIAPEVVASLATRALRFLYSRTHRSNSSGRRLINSCTGHVRRS